MSSYTLFLIYILVIAIAALAVILLILWRGLLRRGLISRSLNLVLIMVRFPPQAPQENSTLQQIREKIALMEQFYANLAGLRDKWWRLLLYGRSTFALELAIPEIGEELTFYVAVPRRLVEAVGKVIQGIFPDAHIEESRDYNIFNPEGRAVGSEVVLKENRYYPIRTYQKLEGDPLKELANVFTKLAKEGEGASFQIVARPARKKWARRLRERARLLYQGKEKGDILMKTVGALSSLTSTGKSPEMPQKPEDLKRITPLQEEMVRSLESKASKPLFEVNIRLIASARDETRARSILGGLELAFNQFVDPNLNRFRIISAGSRTLRKLIFNFSFRAFNERRIAVLSTEELTSLFHFPNLPIETPKIGIQKARQAPPPVNLPEEGLVLGYSVFRGEKRDVRITEADRRRHVYIIGQTGTGKSVLMKNMARQDIQEGRGVCFIDPHGDAVEELLGFVPRYRSQDVIYFNPGDIQRPLGLNMLEYDPERPEQKTLIVNELIGIFHKLYGAVPEALGPAFEQYFRNATMLVMEDPSSGNTLLEIARVFSDRDFRHLKLSRSKNVTVNQFWTKIAEQTTGEQSLQNFAQYVTSKFDVFLANEIMRPIIAQEKSAFNLREIMDSQKILLVNLTKGRLGDINSSLIGLIIVGKLLIAALSRVEIAEEERRKDFYLYIDEFQNVTTDSIATILSEARKYRLALTITHQFIGQLKEEIKKAVFGNAGSIISFRIGSDDSEFMAKQYKPVFAEQDLLNIDNFNCYLKLLIRGATSPPFNIRTYPLERGDKETAEIIKEISRTKYGRPREEIEREIVEKHGREL